MSSFGKKYKITTYGEYDSKSVGVIIEGCPYGMYLNEYDIQKQLNRTKRNSTNMEDNVEIQSGVNNGITTGRPICAMVKFNDSQRHDKNNIKIPHIMSIPINYDNLTKYSESRITYNDRISRTIGGAVADKWLKIHYGIDIVAWVSQIGYLKYNIEDDMMNTVNTIQRTTVDNYVTRCPNHYISDQITSLLTDLKEKGDTIGGVITCICRKVPISIGKTKFDQLEAVLAQAMMSIPLSKGFEVGNGFRSAEILGSKDFSTIKNMVNTQYNIMFNVGFKAPSITDINTKEDNCVVNKIVPVVESMAALTIMDAIQIK